MLPIAWYLLKVIICSGILFGYYWLLLRNKIFHQYNRFYLLAAVILSLALPLIQIGFWQQQQRSSVVKVLQAVSSGDEYVSEVIIRSNQNHWSVQELFPIIYWLVSGIFIVLLFRTLIAIRTLLKKYPVQELENISLVNTDDKNTPFSFLNYIFWNTNIDPATTTGKQIFKHELVHVQEKHTYDKLFINIVLLFGWCNPFFWLIRKELNMIHEFIADKKAVEDSDTAAFAAMILQSTYPQHRFQLANNFFYSPIKRRLLMLTRNKNPRVNYFARIMVLPLAVLVFAAFTLKTKAHHSFYNGKKITVVIDAGHGGVDAGAKSPDGTVSEKDLTLAIIKKIKELNSNDKIDIVLTRDDDSPLDITNRILFAQEHNADLYLSFHVDNGPKGTENTHTGISVWVPKDEYSNSGGSKILASSIISEFNNNYGLPVMLQPGQREKGIITIEGYTYPAVLVEAGFINNDKDLAYLQTETAKETIAKNILAAIEKFAAMNNTALTNIAAPNITDTVPPKLPTASQWRTAELKKIDTRKALIIYNGKIIGKAEHADDKVNKIYTGTVYVKWLTIPEAIAKYGKQGEDGACEITTADDKQLSSSSLMEANRLRTASDLKPGEVITLDTFPLKLKEKLAQGTKLNNEQLLKLKQDLNEQQNLDLKEKLVQGTKLKATDAQLLKLKQDLNEQQNFNLKEKVVQGTKLKATDAQLLKLKQDLNEQQSLKGNLVQGMKLKASDAQLLKLKQDPNTLGSIKLEEPKIFWGNLRGGRVNIENFKAQKEIQASTGYSFVSATVYFQGPGFDNAVVLANLNSPSLSSIQNTIDRCQVGSTVIFDNVRVKDNAGSLLTLTTSPAFILAGNNIQNDLRSVVNDKVFTQVETPASFTGGKEAWIKFLQANLKVTTPVDNGAKAGKYTVVLKFIVKVDGSLSDVSCENDPGYGICAEAMRFIKITPKWQPAVQNGQKVNAYLKQPITFLVEEQ